MSPGVDVWADAMLVNVGAVGDCVNRPTPAKSGFKKCSQNRLRSAAPVSRWVEEQGPGRNGRRALRHRFANIIGLARYEITPAFVNRSRTEAVSFSSNMNPRSLNNAIQ